MLHGRLSSAEKQAVLTDFAAGKTQVLVSTTVVEVGVDVPEASVMVIDHAERFGLAQLHQLRGRVGRGAAASHCLLINGSSNPWPASVWMCWCAPPMASRSPRWICACGPGQVLGTRQSGLPDLALASLADDGAVLEDARTAAQELLNNDPELEQHPLLRETLEPSSVASAAAPP